MYLKKSPPFKGIATALVTPFRDGVVDFDALGLLIDWQISCGVSAIVVCGTTGEAPTLSVEELTAITKYAVNRAARRVPIIAGSGSNCTKKAIELSRLVEKSGADALLVVTPYYNKASQNGLIKHYLSIADSVSLPIILYNVPSRTGVDIPLEVYKALSDHENIVAVKEARGNTGTVGEFESEQIPLHIYAGNDNGLCDMLDVGASGCISATSNIIPREMVMICDSYFSGVRNEAVKYEKSLYSFFDAMFCEVNPIPIKYAMSLLGLCSEEMRLPLCTPSDISAQRIRTALEEYGLI